MPLDKIDQRFVEEIEQLAPFGPENPALVWLGENLTLRSSKAVGRGGDHQVVTLEDQHGSIIEAIRWQGSRLPLPEGHFDLAYSARTTDFRGQHGISIEWIDARPTERERLSLGKAQKLEVVDYRNVPHPMKQLEAILANGKALVWREGKWSQSMPGATRAELSSCAELVIWSAPPSLSILRDGMTKVRPVKVYLFNNPAGYETPRELLLSLAQWVKYALNHYDGKVDLTRLAPQCGQREATVLTAIELLEAKGIIHIRSKSLLEVVVEENGKKDPSSEPAAEKRFKALLEDTHAYRAYYAKAATEAVIQRDMS